MRKIYSLLFAGICFTLGGFAQNVNVNPGAGSYPDLTSAFAAINAGTHTGAVTVDIINSTTETASAVLNASGVGSASYTGITISPAGGAALTITGSIAGHLVDLNGADNVVFDGLNSGGNSLTISNTNTGTGASTIRFTGDATGNTVTRCTVLGSTGSALSSGFGVIYFATGTTTGNDNNTISNCNIAAAGTNLPINGIFSSGTSTAIDNSGITISNNNIFDYFNANGATAGMNINSANSGWTINGNSLYQTATRTYLTANVHNGIIITSGSGYTITNNFIGGSAASAGGTPYAMAGTIATRFVGINMSVGTTTAVSSVQGNTIANFTLNTSSGAATTNGIICGINITGGNVNVGTVTGNTIGATSGVDNIRGVSTTAGGMVVGINSSSTGTIAIQNNTIGALTSSGITAAISGNITGVNISGAAAAVTISGNTIGNATANNMRGGTTGLTTGSSLVSGINLVSTPTTATITGNTIQNLTSFGTGTAGYVRGVQTATSALATAVNWSISNNTINNLTTNSTLAGLGSGLVSALGIHHLSSQGCIIAQNNISNISNINTTATTNIIVAGIFSANATATTTLGTTISRNRIWGLSNATIGTTALTPPIVTGIAVRSGNNITTIANNMVALGNGQTTNTSFIGIWCQNGSTPNPTLTNVHYNTVNIDGGATAGALPSFAFLRSLYVSATANTAAIDVRNNILQNARSGGTGQHFAISNGFNATAVSAVGWGANASNFNLLNANPATIGHWTSALNFAGWKTAAAGDLNSLSGNTATFVNTAAGDLHLNMGVTPTPIESGGTPITGLTTDFDNQVRPGPAGSVNGGAFAPDLGADEFDGVYLDILPPAISYTPLGFTCATGNRTLVATITDFSGIPTSGAGLPVLYWRINAGAFVPVTATSLGGSQYQFVFGAGATTGDLVSYYIAAQDLAATPNVAVAPAAGAAGLTANPPAAATPPTTLSSYAITTVLAAGTYTVGATGTYTTLTAAINDYNTRCLGGAIVFELLDATYNEAGAMTIIKHPDASAVNTLTIRPAAGVTAAVNATVANGATLRILGNYVTIDGSNNGTTSRNLTITNASATSPSVVLIGSTGTSPINNTALRNSIIINGANSNTAIVVSDGTASGTEGYFNNITISNNDVQRAFIGIFNIAAFSPGNGNGLTITNNTMTTSGANAIRRVGIYLQGVDGATVSGNTIANIDAASAENDYGVWLATNTANTTVANNTISALNCTLTANAPSGIFISSGLAASNITVSDNTITGISSAGGGAGAASNGIFAGFATGGLTILRNQVSNIKNTSGTGWGAAGIGLNTNIPAANTTIANNFVSDVAALGFNGNAIDDNGYGIVINAGAGYNVWHNTVLMNTNQVTTAGVPAAMMVTNGVTAPGAINMRNNIFVNTQTAGTARYAIYSGAANTVFSAIDYNDYFSAGPNLAFIGSDRLDLPALQAAFGGNTNSTNLLPSFVSATDLHLVAAGNCTLDGLGTPIAGITTDIDAQNRSLSAPDMGADEFNPAAIATTFIAGTIAPGAIANQTSNYTFISGATDYLNTCNLIATITPGGASPVTGAVTAGVRLDTGATKMGTPRLYVARFYDVLPATNAATATGTVKLYFLQSEFDNYNLKALDSNYYPLPDNGANTVDSLRILIYHGAPSGGFFPGNYTGTVEELSTADAGVSVVWNPAGNNGSGWWEISFPANGFSGYFISSKVRNPLPIKVEYFRGAKQGSSHVLDWKVVPVNTVNGTLSLERSADGRNFSSIYSITASAIRMQQPFNYATNNLLKGTNYYRLKLTDDNGVVTYSGIVALLNGNKGFELVNITPNPVTEGRFKLNITAAEQLKMEVVVTDMAGRIVSRQTNNLISGFNAIEVNVNALANGMYQVMGIIEGERTRVVKFVKE